MFSVTTKEGSTWPAGGSEPLEEEGVLDIPVTKQIVSISVLSCNISELSFKLTSNWNCYS